MDRKRRKISILLAVIILLSFLAYNSKAEDNYIIGEEDVLDIFVWNNPDLSRKVTVRPDGMISLPLVNDVKAKGLTPMALRNVLIKKLSEFVETLDLTV
ncbi:MAG: sugar ABC transporter substrate-binding protein, partial [Candidatus Schekmanbacteria bacterium]